jgi:hypothetical protein
LKNFKKRLRALQYQLGIDNRLLPLRIIRISIDIAPLTDGTIPLPPIMEVTVAAALDALDGPRIFRRPDEGFTEFLDRAGQAPFVDPETDRHSIFIIVREPFTGEVECAEDRARRRRPLNHPDNLRPKVDATITCCS